jgi:hypothetical protein
VESDGLISRGELTATILAILDINVNLTYIIDLLEGGDDGAEWPEEDDP